MARFRLIGEGPADVGVFVALVNRYKLPLADKGKEVPDELVIECPGGDAAVLRTLRTIEDDKDQRFLDADSPDARSFVAWLCRLYGLASPRLTTS